ncbi:MAG: hypothetical protein COB98_09260 [Flavobacteriaceae bacterium]|nr:MAG: hypothetical protein COB98_09260 [Flavobacteriaceae bacterium]
MVFIRAQLHASYLQGLLFYGAIKGNGGCPMAKDDLTGNMPTERLVSYFNQQKSNANIRVINFNTLTVRR